MTGSKKINDFRNWVKDYGPNRLASELKVCERTVNYWTNHVTVPSTKHLFRIAKLSGNKFHAINIIDEFMSHQ